MIETSHLLLLQDLALVMIVAGVVTLIFHQLRQPVVLGFILAGALIGPHTAPWQLISDQRSIETLAELGVIFLMFSLGLDFSLKTLRRIGSTAFIGALVQILAMIWIGYELGQLFGWSRMDSLFLGAILCISSTTITLKVLTELGRTKEKFAEISLGILIVEDILAIALIALLSGVAVTGELYLGSTLKMLGQIIVFFIVVVVVGMITVPPLLRNVAKFQSNEMMLVTVLGLCFGVSLITVKLGYSVALGAFLIGTIIGEAREIHRIRVLTEPVRDMFSAVFFVSIGMLIEPALLRNYTLPIIIVTTAVVVGKVLTRAVGVFLAGNDTRTSLRVAMSLAQIGEFSFIIAALGVSLKVTSEFVYPIAVSVSAVTTLLTPFLVRGSDGVVARFDRVAPGWMVGSMELYSRWIARLRGDQTTPGPRKLARKWTWQIILNMALVTGVFTAAAAAAGHAEHWWPAIPQWIGGARGIVWLGAAMVALPALIAAVRKLQALAMLLSEMSVGSTRSSPSTRGVVYHIVFGAGVTAIAVWVLMVSSAFLPTGPAMIVLPLIAAVLTFLLWRFFIQVHAKAQAAVLETFASLPLPPEGQRNEMFASMLKDAKLEAVTVPASSFAVGKLIRELELRTQTGASAVGIERGDGRSIINPGPNEVLQSGDRVLLLGQEAQLEAARVLLTSERLAANVERSKR